jgi:hypothetical protein
LTMLLDYMVHKDFILGSMRYFRFPGLVLTMIRNIYLLWFIFFYATPNCFAQSDSLPLSIEDTFYRHRFTLLMANSHMPSAVSVQGSREYLIVPTWGLDYDYWITKKFGTGLHTDVVLQQYQIEEHSDKAIVERSFPVAVNFVGLYKPLKPLTVMFGGGIELEKNKNFLMACLGLEYGIELPKQWELSFNLFYESKIEAYDSWFFGIGFSKYLKRK